MAAYYAQRASAGLIISEATGISREGLGWPNAPGLMERAPRSRDGSRSPAVHDAWRADRRAAVAHGRLVHPERQRHGAGVVVGDTAPDYAHTYEGKTPYVEARAATGQDIGRIIGDYAAAARNAIAAGLRRRADPRRQWLSGRPIPARRRQFPRRRIWRLDRQSPALHDRGAGGVGAEIGMDRVGIRFSPNIHSQGVEDTYPHRAVRSGRRAPRGA